MAESHYFDVHIAKLYGVHCAVVLQNIWHWIRKNEANGVNLYDGTYWTYNSTKAFADLFPYLSQKQIENALKKLRDEGIIITGNYNVVKYDRTLWYAITEKGKSILLAGEMEITDRGNGNDNEGEPIPNINTDCKTSNKKQIYKEEFDELWKLYPNKKGKDKALGYYIKAREDKTTFEQVKKGIENYNAEIKERKTETRFIKNGSTWFNQHCWNDEYQTGQAEQGKEDSDYMKMLEEMGY
jgi:DNA-binding PadR family transcriptional regulator